MAERDVDFYASLGDLTNGIASRDKLIPTLSTGEPVSFGQQLEREGLVSALFRC